MYKPSYRLLYQHVYIRDYDFKSRTISAATKLTFEPLQDDVQFIKLNCRQCQIRKVEARIADTLSVANAEQRSGAQSVSLECAISYNDPSICFEPLMAEEEQDEMYDSDSDSRHDLSLAEAALSDAQRETAAECGGGELTVRLPGLVQALIRERRIRFFTIRVEYTLERPQAGVHFDRSPAVVADDEEDSGATAYEALYTSRSGETRYWLPCVEADAAVCLWRFELAVRVADGHVPLAPGSFAGVSRTRVAAVRRGAEQDGDRLVYTFTLRTPTAARNVGFLIGTFDCLLLRQPDAPRLEGEDSESTPSQTTSLRTSSNEPFETHVYYPRVLRELLLKALRVRAADGRRTDDDCSAAQCPFSAAERLLSDPERASSSYGTSRATDSGTRFRARHTHLRSSECVFFELFGAFLEQLGVSDRVPFAAYRCVFTLTSGCSLNESEESAFATYSVLDSGAGTLQNETLPEAAILARRALVQCVARQLFGVLVAPASFSARWLVDGLASHLASSFLADAQHRRASSVLRTGANEERWRAAQVELQQLISYESQRCPLVLDPRRFLDNVAGRIVNEARSRRQNSLLRTALSRSNRPVVRPEADDAALQLDDSRPVNKKSKKKQNDDANDELRADRDGSSRANELRRWFAASRARRTCDWFVDGAQTRTHRRMRLLKAKLAVAVLEQRLGRDAFRDVLAKLIGAALDASARTHLRSAARRPASQADEDADGEFGWQPMLLSTDSFIRVVRKVVGKDITEWIDSVAAQPGLARLSITYVHNRKRDSVELEIRQATSTSEPVNASARFSGQLSVLVQEQDGPFVHTVTVRDSDKASRAEVRLHSRASTTGKRDRGTQPSALTSRRVALASAAEVDLDLQAASSASAFLADGPTVHRVEPHVGAVLWLRVMDADHALLGNVRLRQPLSALLFIAAHERDALAQADALQQLQLLAASLMQIASTAPVLPAQASSAFAEATGPSDAHREHAVNACTALRRCLLDVVDNERNFYRVRALAFQALVAVANRSDSTVAKTVHGQLTAAFKRLLMPTVRPASFSSYLLVKYFALAFANVRDRSSSSTGAAARCPSEVLHTLVAALQSLGGPAARGAAPFAGLNHSLLRAALLDALGHTVTACAVRVERASQLPADLRLLVSELTRALNVDYRVAVGSFRFAVSCAALSSLRALEKKGYLPTPSALPPPEHADAVADAELHFPDATDTLHGRSVLLPKHPMRFYLDHAEPHNFVDVRLTAIRILLDYVQTDRDTRCFDWLMELVERERVAAIRCAIVEEMMRRPPFTFIVHRTEEADSDCFHSFYVDPTQLLSEEELPAPPLPASVSDADGRAEVGWRRRVRSRLWSWIVGARFHADCDTRAAAVELFYILFGLHRKRTVTDEDDTVSEAVWNKLVTTDHDANAQQLDSRNAEEHRRREGERNDEERVQDAAVVSGSESESGSDDRRRHSSHRKHRRKHHRHRRHKHRRPHRSRSRSRSRSHSPSRSASRSASRKVPRSDS